MEELAQAENSLSIPKLEWYKNILKLKGSFT